MSSSSSTSTTPQHSPVYHVPQLCPAPNSKSAYPFSGLQSPFEDTPLEYYVHSNPSTPSFDYYSDNRPLDSQYMTAEPSYNPAIRVRQSTPIHGLPDLPYTSPPSMVGGGSNSSWESYDHSTHLSPQSLQQQAVNRGYRTHKRIPSDSSVASVGPDSPYTQSFVYPQIVDADSGLFPSTQIDSYDFGFPSTAHYSKSQYAPQTSQNHESCLAPAFQGYNPASVDAESYHAIQTAMRQALAEQQRGSIMSQPSLPSQGSYGDEYNELSRIPSGHRSSITKLNRTMSDIYQDELYNPPMATSAPPQPPRQHIPQENLLSPQNNSMFNDLLQAAQKGHVTARSASPVTSASRGRSPFATERFSHSTPNSPARLTSAAQIRQQQKAESDARAFAEHQPRPTDILPPRTISPKEVALDYNEAEEDAKMPLFNQDNKRENQLSTFATSTPNLSQSDVDDNTSERSYRNMAPRRRRGSNLPASTASGQSGSAFTFMPPSVPGNIQIPQQYPFISQFRRQDSSLRSTSDQVPEFPTHLTSMESSRSETTQSENPIRADFPSSAESTQRSPSSPALQRPSDTAAASGTFACMSQSCAARFDTAPKLQKHRREAHRNSPPPRPSAAAPTTSTATTPTSVTTPSSSSAALHRNQQTGPHKCERINPSTGKPCNTVFSRSYDLTRHEDTIHSNRKQKVRCHLCTEDKTFSRNDALTRHMRVVHPEVDFPGKTKRRGG
ncbi:MAG: hypothetical protein Q9218_006128 [Villophora microphyllina]